MIEKSANKEIVSFVILAKDAVKESNQVRRLSLVDWRIVNHGEKVYTVSIKLSGVLDTDRVTFDIWVTKNIENGKITIA